MSTSEILESRISEAQLKHPGWRLNDGVFEQIKEDIHSYYDDLLADLNGGNSDEGNYIDTIIEEDTGDCSIFLSTPYNVNFSKDSSFLTIISHIDSIFLYNPMIDGENEENSRLEMLLCYKNLFFSK